MSSTTTHSPLSWKQADHDVHVATRDGEYAGFVEVSGDDHVVHDNRGTELGSFPALSEARRALEVTPRRRPRGIRSALRRSLSLVRP
ncbi:hypothetical protein [Microbacterium sp. GXF6406]